MDGIFILQNFPAGEFLKKHLKMKGVCMEYLILLGAVVISVTIGIFIGIFIGTDRMRKAVEERSVGNLRIDRSEPDEPPRPFLEVRGATIESIAREEFVVLKVVNENYISPN